MVFSHRRKGRQSTDSEGIFRPPFDSRSLPWTIVRWTSAPPIKSPSHQNFISLALLEGRNPIANPTHGLWLHRDGTGHSGTIRPERRRGHSSAAPSISTESLMAAVRPGPSVRSWRRSHPGNSGCLTSGVAVWIHCAKTLACWQRAGEASIAYPSGDYRPAQTGVFPVTACKTPTLQAGSSRITLSYCH